MALTKINKTQNVLEGSTAVDTSNALIATVAAGSPITGYFHSTVVGRAPLPRLDKDSKVRMGIERIQMQSIVPLQDEFGAAGEPVFSVVNDDKNLIRFVGNWSSVVGTTGPYVIASVGAVTDIASYIEITFYGTGLNILVYPTGGAVDYRSSVDGGSESSNYMPAQSGLLVSRNYPANIVVPVVSGLSLGVHTVKLRKNDVISAFIVYGFEILNQSSQLKVTPGGAYEAGMIFNSSAVEQSIAYNSSFESGTLGTRGGRVVVYQKSDGSIAKAVLPVDSSSFTLSSANHANEEVARTYHFREFGAGRADDFSLLASVAGSKAFTLDDGTTALVGSNAVISGITGNLVNSSASSFTTITFVGSGLDIVQIDDGVSIDIHSVAVDGTGVGNLTAIGTANTVKITKIVSGLPYGTHTVRITRTAAVSNASGIKQFIVYQPKKPAIPTGTIELADYNIMADFVANAAAGTDTIATGILRKVNTREMVYVDGTGGLNWTTNLVSPNTGSPSGFEVATSQSNGYLEYTFFGTGFDFRFTPAANRSSNITVSLNTVAVNASYPGASSITYSVYGTGVTFGGGAANSTALLSTVASNILDQLDASTTYGSGFRISGLPLAKYTVRFNQAAAAGVFLVASCLDIITPIHSPKSNTYGVLQNTLSVGSCGISDSRKFEKSLETKKAWAQAIGIASASLTTINTWLPMPDMSVTIKTSGGPLQLNHMVNLYHSASVNAQVAFYVNGVPVGSVAPPTITTAFSAISNNCIHPVPPGVHKVDVYWWTSSATLQTLDVRRTLTVREL